MYYKVRFGKTQLWKQKVTKWNKSIDSKTWINTGKSRNRAQIKIIAEEII